MDTNIELNLQNYISSDWTILRYNIANIVIWIAIFTICSSTFLLSKNKETFKIQKPIKWIVGFMLLCSTIQLILSTFFKFPIFQLHIIFLLLTVFIFWICIIFLQKYSSKILNHTITNENNAFLDKHTKEITIAYNHLAESEQQFKTLVNNNPDIISRIGSDMRYKFMNESILNVRKFKIEDIVGKTVMELRDSADVNNNLFITYLNKAFETGEKQLFEFSTHTNTTLESYFSLSIIPLKNEINGNVDNVLTVTKDITKQINNEKLLKDSISNLQMLAEKLEKKRKILEDFTFIVSHNLRSPVANLSALFNLIDMEHSIATKELMLTKVREAFNILSVTVSDLSNVVQIRQNTELPKEKLNFEDILKNNLKNLDYQIVISQAEITFDFQNIESIEYPKIYLESIFLNLLTNAIKYRSESRTPKIKFITTIDNQGIICLICEDNGLGIDMKKYGHKIFGLNKTFHHHPDAKGVGLFITKNQIETMGGTIYVTSEVDEGTIFTIVFNSYCVK